MSELTLLRSQIDDFLQRHPQSPLDQAHRRDFQGLDYFSLDPSFVVSGPVSRFPEDDPLIEMQTSSGAVQWYRRWGRFDFEIDGQTASLIIYVDPQGHDLFLPFKDTTNGQETYGAGRYLDSHRPGLSHLRGDLLEVDFNFAYNPYCAYSEHYSCPLPPRENWLAVPIRAGEKDFR